MILLDRGYGIAANRLQLAAILENAFPFPESNGAVANCPPPLPKTNKTVPTHTAARSIPATSLTPLIPPYARTHPTSTTPRPIHSFCSPPHIHAERPRAPVTRPSLLFRSSAFLAH